MSLFLPVFKTGLTSLTFQSLAKIHILDGQLNILVRVAAILDAAIFIIFFFDDPYLRRKSGGMLLKLSHESRILVTDSIRSISHQQHDGIRT